MTDEELKQIKEAAREGAREGAKESSGTTKIKVKSSGGGCIASITSSIVKLVIIIAIIAAFVLFGLPRLIPTFNPLSVFNREEAVENHDMTLENNGVLGYTVADFQEAILGDSKQLKKLEVYSQNVSDVATITEAGLGKFKVFSKSQCITYNGTATYTVDLSDLDESDISLDEDKKIITLKVPKVKLDSINIPSKDIKFGKTNKGKLAFGSIKLTAEQLSKIQTAAEKKMKSKLKKEKVINNAKTAAKMSIWEIYQPVINGVATGYSLEVEIK